MVKVTTYRPVAFVHSWEHGDSMRFDSDFKFYLHERGGKPLEHVYPPYSKGMTVSGMSILTVHHVTVERFDPKLIDCKVWNINFPSYHSDLLLPVWAINCEVRLPY